MIDYKIKSLRNGLTVIAHQDTSTRLAAVNILYKVGARNENPERTGFAHLFEHLMFRGTENIPDFDLPVQQACGENNAFTNNDYTDYYITLPKDNVETALWLESDRMGGLNISEEALATEKKVVIEEFNQHYINQSYGDQWMLLRDMVYKVHPYRWATIGRSPDHVEGARLEDVREFYRKFYSPGNAIISIAGDIETGIALELAEKWFGDIPGREMEWIILPQEPEQTDARRKEVTRQVPADAVTIAFRIGGRTSREFYICDVISDLLAGGSSARLYQRLVKEKKLFSGVNAYITGDMDPGMFLVSGQLNPGIGTGTAEAALWEELSNLCIETASDYEIEKVKNKFEAGTIFGELNIMNKAMNLCFYNMLGDMSLLNREVDIFRSITAEEIKEAAARLFRPENSSTLIYHRENEQ